MIQSYSVWHCFLMRKVRLVPQDAPNKGREEFTFSSDEAVVILSPGMNFYFQVCATPFTFYAPGKTNRICQA